MDKDKLVKEIADILEEETEYSPFECEVIASLLKSHGLVFKSSVEVDEEKVLKALETCGFLLHHININSLAKEIATTDIIK